MIYVSKKPITLSLFKNILLEIWKLFSSIVDKEIGSEKFDNQPILILLRF